MKKIILAVLTASVMSNAGMFSYMEASEAKDNARAANRTATENKRSIEVVKEDVQMLNRKVKWMKDSIHTLNVKLDSLQAQNREILELLKSFNTDKKGYLRIR